MGNSNYKNDKIIVGIAEQPEQLSPPSLLVFTEYQARSQVQQMLAGTVTLIIIVN